MRYCFSLRRFAYTPSTRDRLACPYCQEPMNNENAHKIHMLHKNIKCAQCSENLTIDTIVISNFIKDYGKPDRFPAITNFNQKFEFTKENCSSFPNFRNYISTLVKADATAFSSTASSQQLRRDQVRGILDSYIKKSLQTMSWYSMDLVSGKVSSYTFIVFCDVWLMKYIMISIYRYAYAIRFRIKNLLKL